MKLHFLFVAYVTFWIIVDNIEILIIVVLDINVSFGKKLLSFTFVAATHV